MTEEFEEDVFGGMDDIRGDNRVAVPDVGHIRRRVVSQQRWAGIAVVALLIVGLGGFWAARPDTAELATGGEATASEASPAADEWQLTLSEAQPRRALNSESYESLAIDEASELAESNGQEWRVSMIDGASPRLFTDVRPGRLNFVVEDNIVVQVIVESDIPPPSHADESPVIQVPPVAGFLIDAAVSEVEAAGLNAEIRYVDDTTGISEHVLRTDPPVGSKIVAGSTVVLVTQEPVEVAEDPEGIPFIALEKLIADNPDIFVGYYVEGGLRVVKTSPSADLLSARAMIEDIPNLDFTISACTRSSEELAAIVDDLKEFSSQIGLDSATLYGIDTESCSVLFGATLSAAQEDQFAAEFGDSVTIEPDFSWSRKFPTLDE